MMLTIESFIEPLGRPNHSDWLHVAVDANNAEQFYIIVNGGMGNTISAPIEHYPPKIKECVIEMLFSGELIAAKKTALLLEINALVYYLSSTLKGEP